VGGGTVPGQGLALQLKAVPDNVARVRQAVGAFAQACGANTERVTLATTEAVSNVVRHAYRCRAIPGDVRVSAKVEGSELLVTVSDDGPGLQPRVDSPGFGMGPALIGAFTEGTSFKSSDPGLDLTMRFSCSP
jgi:serine/threonine-protein kinase RsbW